MIMYHPPGCWNTNQNCHFANLWICELSHYCRINFMGALEVLTGQLGRRSNNYSLCFIIFFEKGFGIFHIVEQLGIITFVSNWLIIFFLILNVEARQLHFNDVNCVNDVLNLVNGDLIQLGRRQPTLQDAVSTNH